MPTSDIESDGDVPTDNSSKVVDLAFVATEEIGEGVEIPLDVEFLDLTSNRLRRINEKLLPLQSLTRLVLRSNFIATIENIHALTQLVELDLYENQLKKIENLETLGNLR
eukprot:TRINITY_DN1191_c0_g1_i5.p1 TRINITY_DN1191_c0_g1~~TRINITY_DN1191_c0_g1_i5.p1  ORF type:complete len:110 (+),score=29.44 TRINITY_DN1191_c0_g1_i5:46-375(+)